MIWFAHSDFNTTRYTRCTAVYFTIRLRAHHTHQPDALAGLPSISFRCRWCVLFIFNSLLFMFYVFLFIRAHSMIIFERESCSEVHSLNFNYDSFEFGWINCIWLWLVMFELQSPHSRPLSLCSNFNSHLTPCTHYEDTRTFIIFLHCKRIRCGGNEILFPLIQTEGEKNWN